MLFPSPYAWKMAKENSQSHPGEYDCLGPYPMQNTRGRLYPYIPGSFHYPNHGMP